MKKHNGSCPVDYRQIDQNLVRAYAFIIFVILLFLLLFKWKGLLVILILDFFLRLLFGIKGGLFCRPLSFLLRALKIAEKPINALPKKFAVKIGFLFSILLGIFYLSGWHTAYGITLYIFLIAVGLEVFFNFCLACYFYGFFTKNSSQDGIFK